MLPLDGSGRSEGGQLDPDATERIEIDSVLQELGPDVCPSGRES